DQLFRLRIHYWKVNLIHTLRGNEYLIVVSDSSILKIRYISTECNSDIMWGDESFGFKLQYLSSNCCFGLCHWFSVTSLYLPHRSSYAKNRYYLQINTIFRDPSKQCSHCHS